MESKFKEIRFVLLVSVLSLIVIPLSSWFAHKPLRASSPRQLMDQGFQPQNRSDVVARIRNKVGWNALQNAMVESGATTAEAEKVLAAARPQIAVPYHHGLRVGQLWPMVVREAWVGPKKVWLLEAAAPNPPHIWYCGTGMSWWENQRLAKRIPEQCGHRVLVIQSQSPYAVLDQRDLIR